MNEAKRKIEEALRRDPKQLEKLDTEMSRLVKPDTGIASEEAFIRAIKTVLGVDISLSDLDRAKAEAEELDPEELEEAAGGGKGGSDIENFNWCMADYACFAAVKHDTNSGSHEEACWKDYICSFIYQDGIFACTAADKF